MRLCILAACLEGPTICTSETLFESCSYEHITLSSVALHDVTLSVLDRPGADGMDTIEVDIWVTLLPPGNFTAATVWADLAPPDGRVWNRTGQFNVPMNVTFVNATTVTVRSRCSFLAHYQVCRSFAARVAASALI